uniref:Uncharacterized protein n=1 Tax=Falco tinnunculus TaxID=100819 RepID=A0A8C4TXX5_FALTI
MPQQWVLPPGRSPPDHGELRATCGRMVPAWDGATLLPSTRLLLKRREVAEVERALQSQREVRAAPSPSACPLPGGCSLAVRRLAPILPWVHRHGAMLSAPPTSAAAQPPPIAQFQDVPDMLAHFGALAGVRAALAQRAGAGWEQLAQHRAQLRRYREEASGKLLCTNSELAQLRARLEAAHSDMLQGESCWAHIQSTAAQKTLLLGQVKLAVLHLFQLATTRLSVGTDVALEDTEAQLDMVLLCMQDLAAICAELHPGQPAPRPHLPAAPRMP